MKKLNNPISLQGYLEAQPQGIDARYAWNFKGGHGEGKVRFIDIERGWLTAHEALQFHQLHNTGINDWRFEDHGAAVLGVVMMQHKNADKPKGITPFVKGSVISEIRSNGVLDTADAILAAIEHLTFGDILLIETQVHYPGTQGKTWPVEVEEVNYEAITEAIRSGIIVIEAAGNGGSNLDDFMDIEGNRILNGRNAGSGAIIVGAASSSYPHTRLAVSNHGSRVDCYAWGENVTTAGSFPRSSGAAINTYTHRFNGTSSAAAIIAGAAIAVQSIMEAHGRSRLSPEQMREVLSSEKYGTPSENGRHEDKIGVMPDLHKIITHYMHITLAGPKMNGVQVLHEQE